jgi:hypothetical protein
MKNNIDKIFNKSLKNYERQPRTEAWGKLQARLEKKDSKVLPLWWKYASAASVALLLGVGGYWFVNNSSTESQTVATISKVKTQPTVKLEPEILSETKPNENVIAKKDDLKKENVNSVVGVIGPMAGVHTSSHQRKQIPVLTAQSVSKINPENSPQVHKQTQQLENQNNQIIALETIKIKTPEIKDPKEENTIVLVLENTKPKKEEETIVLNFVETKPEVIAQNIEPEKKQSRVGKIWEQLKRAKNGENVNWGEVGVKPQKVLARADAKIENALTRGESNDK